MPALDYVNKDGTIYEIVPEIAHLFSTSTSYAVGDCVIKDAVLYRFKTAHAAGAWVGTDAEVIEVGDELTTLKNEKAEKTFSNPDMGAGYASQLVSSVGETDATPYNFRKVPYDATLEDGSIVGASVVYNQFVQNGNFADTSNWGTNASLTVSASGNVLTTVCTSSGDRYLRQSIPFVIGHRYLQMMDAMSDSASGNDAKVSLTFYGTDSNYRENIVSSANTWTHFVNVFQCGANTYNEIRLNNRTSGVTHKYRNVMIIDLTAMFGSTIADYVYSLETATAGSGVAWLKEHFPKQFGGGYQAYNAGEIKSINGLSAHRSVGFNQWDEQWEDGLISGTTGQNVNGNGIRSKNMNRCIPNTSYYYKTPGNARYVMWYDADENFISPGYRESDGVLTSPSNAAYFRLRVDGITTYSNNICINISKTTGTPKNGDYVPYESHSYALDSTKTLRGILKLDSSNSLYADGDRYLADGTVTHYWKEVTYDGSEEWAKDTNLAGYYRFYVNDNSIKVLSDYRGQIINSRGYETANSYGLAYDPTGDVVVTAYNIPGSVNWIYIAVKESMNISTVDAFKAWLAQNPVTLVLQLATPTTESASPYGNPQVINPDGTESYVYTDGSFELPVGHESEYPVNVSGQLDDILDTPSANGTYTLQATVADGKVSYEWVSAT